METDMEALFTMAETYLRKFKIREEKENLIKAIAILNQINNKLEK